MADVRSLLRNERASRRIAHPAASYTEAGKLLCNVCAVQIKNESQWDNHIRSPQHNHLVQRARESLPQGKKRKAGNEEDESHKRVKGVPDSFFDQPRPDVDDVQVDEDVVAPQLDLLIPDATPPIQDTPSQPPAASTLPTDIDEDEWAAFEADIAATQAQALPISATTTISAAPMTAEEIAAQAREDQSTQRGKREAEIEAEKEDANQALQDEFDEMEELEDRVRKLREKREALRKAREGDHELLPDVPASVPARANGTAAMLDDEEDDDDDDEEEDDDFDDWKFGAN